MIDVLSEEKLADACAELAKNDEDLARIFEKYGTPPLWDRSADFASLIHIILEQQVSLASALSAFNKLKERLGNITPEGVLSLSDEELKACYFSRQKTVYARDLASAIVERKLDLLALPFLPEDEVRVELKKIKGIGDWTSDIYLIMALLRPDVMPRGDLALHVAWQKLKGLEKRPSTDEFVQMAVKWTPFRSVAARLLWHFYLSERKKTVS